MIDEGHRRHIEETYQAALVGFDKAILTLSAGAFALSITFVHDIAPAPAAGSAAWIVAAWISLALSVVVLLISMLTGQLALEAVYRTGEDATATRITTALNWSAFVALVIGIACLIAFAAMNLQIASNATPSAAKVEPAGQPPRVPKSDATKRGP